MNKKLIIIIGVNLLCLTAFLVCHAVSAAIVRPLNPDYAARVWAGESDERFAQLAVFFPYGYGFDEEKTHQVRSSIDAALLAVSLDARGERRLYNDAWAAEGTVEIEGQRGRTSASAVGVGGDFFLFHPLRLRGGSYFSPNDIMRDRVLLDEELAWRLYGSVNLAGLEVMINGRPFVIAGVVSRESGFAYGRVYDGGAGLFMSHEALDAVTGSQTRVSTYEIVMPDIVTDFAMDTLKNAFSNDESLRFVSNTHRFGSTNLFSLISSFGERGIRADAISYPYWENAAVFAEDWLALLLVISVLVMLCPGVFAVIYGVKLTRFAYAKAKDKVRALLQARDDRAYARYIEKQNTL